jgi:hypothetical protein
MIIILVESSFRHSFYLEKQRRRNLEVIRQFADAALAQAPMPVI